jgi:hypothetical protein
MGCGLLFGFVLPLWFMLTLVVMQLSPELNGLGADEVQAPRVASFVRGAWLSGQWLVIAMPATVAVLGGFWLTHGVTSRRARAQRRRLDALVASDAVIEGADWKEAVEDVGS